MDANATDQKVEYKQGPAPFNEAEADVVLRSSDHVEFRVPKILLTIFSPVFRDILGMPAPSSASGSATTPSGSPVTVVDVAEHSDVLHGLLSFCHPATCLPKMKVDETYALYMAADKYAIEGLKLCTKEQIETFVDTDPVAVYAMSFREKWEDLAKRAARRTLSSSYVDITRYNCKTLDLLPASAMPKLWSYYDNNRRYLLQAVNVEAIMTETVYTICNCDGRWYDEDDVEINDPERLFYALEDENKCCSIHPDSVKEFSVPVYFKTWWLTFMREVAETIADVPEPVDRISKMPRLFRNAVEEAGRCKRCGPIAYDALLKYSYHLSNELRDAMRNFYILKFDS
ncbi:hypothetical protein K474DRAFT_1670394 [Panus rudis PR-1116 ss-1]|nr:hypothetical protein K474DRAFT_1670394 [Panus rudis PR-1116 ss-1]